MSPDPVIAFLFTLFLPFILLALVGNVIGLRPQQSMLPVRLVAMAIWNLIIFTIKIVIEAFIFFLASRSVALGRKKVRIRLDETTSK